MPRFSQQMDQSIICHRKLSKNLYLVCRELISVLKTCYIKRYYDSKHKVKYDALHRMLREIEA